MAGEIVTPIPSASVIVLRDAPLEVLLLRRHGRSSFVPNAWVFPGGATEPGETPAQAAARETVEECGIALDVRALVPTSRWITPVGVPKRFDTWFFLAVVARDVVIAIDGSEIVDWLWIAPKDALTRADLHLVFPTIRNLEAIAQYDDAQTLLDSRRGAVIEPVQPVLVNGKPTLVE